MKCPVDSNAMKTTQEFGHTLDVCGLCNGVWMDHAELRKIVDNFEFGDFGVFEKWKDIVLEGEPSKNFWQEPVRTCPRDYVEMQRHTFAGDSKIHIDKCQKCGGFWFDGDDIKRLIEYLKPDALEEAMARAIIEEQKDFKKMTGELASIFVLPIRLAQAMSSPRTLFIFIVSGLVNLITEDLRGDGVV